LLSETNRFFSLRLNKNITKDEFKKIYYMEYSHRLIGRFIGLAFLCAFFLSFLFSSSPRSQTADDIAFFSVPIPFFILRGRLSRRTTASMLGLGALIGAQGALGWYMVQSGLSEELIAQASGVPRVSQYRLAAHLGLAFLVYLGCVRTALAVSRDWRIVNGKGLGGIEGVKESLAALNSKASTRMRVLITALTALVFLTAISGTFLNKTHLIRVLPAAELLLF
jgi:cytochrome c oxidase assembly protein subunit 15